MTITDCKPLWSAESQLQHIVGRKPTCTTCACPEHGDVKPAVKSRAQQFLESQPVFREPQYQKRENVLEKSEHTRTNTKGKRPLQLLSDWKNLKLDQILC